MKRKQNKKTNANKKKGAILLSLIICLSFLVGCQNVNDAESSANDFSVQLTDIPEAYDDAEQNTTIIDSSDVSDFTEEQTIPSESYFAGSEVGDNNMPKEDSNSDESEQYIIEGYDFVDGTEKSVCVTLSIESIIRGEEAFKILQEYDTNIIPSNEEEEYIIVNFNVSYVSGEIEELYMMENRASLEQAGLYFALSNSQSNAYDVTSYLSNSIYDISLTKGQSAQGAVAFLQEKGNTKPLVFVGFERIVEFKISD